MKKKLIAMLLVICTAFTLSAYFVNVDNKIDAATTPVDEVHISFPSVRTMTIDTTVVRVNPLDGQEDVSVTSKNGDKYFYRLHWYKGIIKQQSDMKYPTNYVQPGKTIKEQFPGENNFSLQIMLAGPSAGTSGAVKIFIDELYTGTWLGSNGSHNGHDWYDSIVNFYVDEHGVSDANSDKLADDFLKANLTKNGTIITEANDDNYQQILDSEKNFTGLSADVKKAINTKLGALKPGTTYDSLLNVAKEKQLTSGKADAVNNITTDAQKQIDAIKKLSHLSQDEKDTYIKTVTDAADTAKTRIAAATTIAEVNTEKTAYQTLADGVLVDASLLDARNDALNELDSYVSQKKKVINDLNLSDAEKTTLRNAIDDEAKSVKDAIQAETNKNQMTTLLTNGKTIINTIEDDAIAQDFANTYIRKTLKDQVYGAVTSANADQIYSGNAPFGKLTAVQAKKVDAIVSKESGKYKSYHEYLTQVSELAKTSSNSFVKNHMTKADDKIITIVSSETYAQVLSGEADFMKMSQVEKDAVNAQLKAAGAVQTYEEMITASTAIQSKVDDFIETYVTDKDGNIYKEVTSENYLQMYLGTNVESGNWEALDQDVKDAINAKIKAASGKTYEELMNEVNAMVKDMEGFVNKYLVDKKDNLYKDVNTSNYKQILSGQADWAKLPKDQQKAINDLLVANGGKTYEDMLKLAEKLEAGTNQKVKTGDDTNIGMLAILGLISIGGLSTFSKKRKDSEI